MNTMINYFRSLFLFELWKGLSVTGRYFFKKKFTLQYPSRKRQRLRVFAVCMPSVVIRMARNAVLPANCVKRYARQMPSL